MTAIRIVGVYSKKVYFEGKEQECSKWLLENYPTTKIKKAIYKNQYIEDIIDLPVLRDPIFPEPLAKVKA